jgi:hypothetical protein
MTDSNDSSPLDDDFIPAPAPSSGARGTNVPPRPTSRPTVSAAPDQPPSSSGRVRRLGIIGFPNSGKTSWLFALVNGHRTYSIRSGADGQTPGKRAWIMGALDGKFAALVGQEGKAQEATTSGTFKSSRLCEVKRPWLAGLPFATSFWLSIPEVAGETVRKIADGASFPDTEAESARAYQDFLAGCDGILGLVGIDGDRGGRGAVTAVDEALSKIQGFERVLSDAIERREDKRYPIAVTVLITKIDLIKLNPTLDEVVLPRDRSSVGALARERGYEELQKVLALSKSDETTIRFRVNPLMRSKAAAGELRIQECIAADFLRCHAPQAALQMKRLCEIPGLDVRFYLSAPYGRTSLDSEGKAVYPTAGEIKPTMVYEPLEDLLERSWKVRGGSRLRRNMLVAVCVAVLLILFGPIWAWRCERAFDASIEEQAPISVVKANLDALESHWLYGLELQLSEARASAHARRIAAVIARMDEAQDSPAAIGAMEDRAYQLDSSAVVESGGITLPLRNRIAVRVRRELEDFIDGRRSAFPERVDLPRSDVAQVVVFVESRIAGQRSAPEWEAVADRLQKINLVNPAGPCRVNPIEGGECLKSSLYKLLAAARLQPRLSSLATLRLEDLNALAADAARCANSDALRRIDGVIVDRLRGQWATDFQPYSGPDQAQKIAAFLDEKPGFSLPWTEPLRRAFGRQQVNDWVSRFVASSEAGVRGVDGFQEPATVMARLGPEVSRLEQFAAQWTALGAAHPWVAQGMRTGLEEHANRLRERQRLLEEMMTASAKGATALVGAFQEADTASLAQSVSYQVSGDDLLSIDFSRPFRFQEDIMLGRIDTLFDAAVSSGSTADARSMLEARKQLGGTARGANEEIIRLAEQLASSNPDATAIDATLRSLLSDPRALDDHRELAIRSLVNARALAVVAPPVLRCVAGAQNTASGSSKRAWADALMNKMPPERWTQLDSTGLVIVLQSLRETGWAPGSAAAALLQGFFTEYSKEQGLASRTELLEKIAKVHKAAALRPNPGSTAGQLDLDIFATPLRTIRDHYLAAGTKADFGVTQPGMRMLSLLQELRGQGLGSQLIAEIVEAARRHANLVEQWDLVKIRPEAVTASSSAVPPFWFAVHEWTVRDVAYIAKSNALEFGTLAKDPRFPFNPDGSRRGKPVPGEPAQNLRILDAEHAIGLARAGGLRLPTLAEWQAAFARFAPGARPVWPKAADTSTRSDCSPEALCKLMDKQLDGIVGLSFGVREWVSPAKVQAGRSNLQAELPESELRIQPYDSGVRPALDAVPIEFARIR